MPKIKYVAKRFKPESLAMIAKLNEIVAEYVKAGYDLTLRQLYYQCVSRDLIPNDPKAYKCLGSLVNDARLAGLMDWDYITDRTRNLHELASWSDPEAIVAACAEQFRHDLWRDQPFRPEVWIEKEALAGVFQRICDELRVPMFACRGYTSQSEMWAAGMRLKLHKRNGQTPVIFHFGDHDPSGIDMTRDIIDRLKLFTGGLRVDRLALNMDQIEQYAPPPNPAKLSDSRSDVYVREYGDQSWELDALNPETLAGLVRAAVMSVRDVGKWADLLEEEGAAKKHLAAVADRWDEVVEGLELDGD